MPSGDAGVTAARRAAFHILAACHKGRIFERALEDGTRDLDQRDRNLAHELAAGVLRQQSALDSSLAPLVSRDWNAVPQPLRDILRIGAYQLVALDRVPAHAAVATSVALARQVSGDRAGGFVNAVLRRLAAGRAGTRTGPAGSVEADTGAPPDSPSGAELAARYSHPEWLVERWLTRFGQDETARLLTWNNTRPALAVQPARENLARLADHWRDQGYQTEPAPFGQGTLVAARRPDQLDGFERGAFLVQDPAQALVACYAGLTSGTVYDACAAPGGKALAMAHGGARVIAGDRSRLRLQRIRQNVARAGSGREYPMVADALKPPLRPVEAVLLDAPCLGTGTFARHPDARWRVTLEALEGLARQQRDMLDALALVVRPGGMLVYATCSLEPEENECQVESFLARHPEFHREPNRTIPTELLSPLGDLVVLPHRHRMDGAFSTRLRRSGR